MSTYNERLQNVKLMHETMTCMNNEDAYFTWIYTMPDCPQEDDFEWFAGDIEEYNDLTSTFYRLVDAYVDDGFYEPSDEVIDFMAARGYLMSELSIFRDRS